MGGRLESTCSSMWLGLIRNVHHRYGKLKSVFVYGQARYRGDYDSHKAVQKYTETNP